MKPQSPMYKLFQTLLIKTTFLSVTLLFFCNINFAQSANSTLNIKESAGWKFETLPDINTISDEVGKVIFQIKIDDLGYIVSLKTIECKVSEKTLEHCRNAVTHSILIRTKNTPRPPAISTGTITFVFNER